MKVAIDQSKCIGCGTCVSLCPKYFEMGEEGKSVVKGNGAESEVEEADCAQNAVDNCPVRCISLTK